MSLLLPGSQKCYMSTTSIFLFLSTFYKHTFKSKIQIRSTILALYKLVCMYVCMYMFAG